MDGFSRVELLTCAEWAIAKKAEIVDGLDCISQEMAELVSRMEELKAMHELSMKLNNELNEIIERCFANV